MSRDLLRTRAARDDRALRALLSAGRVDLLEAVGLGQMTPTEALTQHRREEAR